MALIRASLVVVDQGPGWEAVLNGRRKVRMREYPVDWFDEGSCRWFHTPRKLKHTYINL